MHELSKNADRWQKEGRKSSGGESILVIIFFVQLWYTLS